ncbi:hypothetical protein Ancab_001239 [Ancistrocladus abbreviatus]
MAENETTEIAVMEEVTASQQHPRPPNAAGSNLPFLSLLPKFQFNFPLANLQSKSEKNVAAVEDQPSNRTDEDSRTYKPDIVKFSSHQPKIPSLKLESEEAEQSSNPLVLWQVYALGGFMIVRWVWAKWQERKKTKRGPSNEEHSPSND